MANDATGARQWSWPRRLLAQVATIRDGGVVIICSCRAVNDRTIRAAIEDGARTLDEIAERCRAGSRCGGCRPAVQEVLAEYGLAEHSEGPRRATYAAV